MAVPNIFANVTTSIPLSQLDTNFATAITLGNTAVYLGNTTTTLGNVTLTNTTVSSVASTFPNSYLANSTATLGNATITLGGTTTTVGNVTTSNVTVTNYIESVVAIGTVTSANTIALTNGTVQTATLTASTACTFTMPANVAGKSFVLLLKQAASTGNGTATFTSVKWGTAGAPTITATAGKMDILTFIADGTNWYGSAAQGYTP